MAQMILIWIGCLIGSLSVLPYLFFLGLLPELNIELFLLTFAQSALLYGIVCSLSYLLIKTIDFDPLSFENPLACILIPGVLSGIFVGLTLLFLEKWVFESSPLSQIGHVPLWAGILASFYGAFNEEVLLRLFLLTGLYVVLQKLLKGSYPIWSMGVAIVSAALVFGLGHLPALYGLIPHPSGFEIGRILILNAIPGIVFGCLYCINGFWTAVTAHFVTDLMIHAV